MTVSDARGETHGDRRGGEGAGMCSRVGRVGASAWVRLACRQPCMDKPS
jgi:hypothetical protein